MTLAVQVDSLQVGEWETKYFKIKIKAPKEHRPPSNR